MMPEDVEHEMKEAAEISMGTEVSDEDVSNILMLTEQVISEKGQNMNPNFRDYKILTAKDVVPIEAPVLETYDEDGPFGAKGIGEPGCVPTAPAIANAIYDAVGVRIKELPITPERVLATIREKKGLDPCGQEFESEDVDECIIEE